MSISASEVIKSFDALPDAARREVALEILRRTRDFDFPPLTDDDLITNAETIFLELDQREMNDERSESQ